MAQVPWSTRRLTGSINRSSCRRFSRREFAAADEERLRLVDRTPHIERVQADHTHAEGLEGQSHVACIALVIGNRERHEVHGSGRTQEVAQRVVGILEVAAAKDTRATHQKQLSRHRRP